MSDWPTWSPPNSLLILDEVQRVWRPRAPGSHVPLAIASLETHRHDGLDFWLITQGAHLIDKSVRMLVGRHVHLVANWAGRKQFEWPECHEDTSSRSTAVTRNYKLPQHVFKLFKSAEVHTKLEKRRPTQFYLFIFCLIALPILIYFVYNRFNGHSQVQAPKSVAAGAPVHDRLSTATAKGYPDFIPSIDGVPESAPAYHPLLKITTAPIMAGCAKLKDDCRCFTGQGTPYPSSREMCLDVLAGHFFNPYAKPRDNKTAIAVQPDRRLVLSSDPGYSNPSLHNSQGEYTPNVVSQNAPILDKL